MAAVLRSIFGFPLCCFPCLGKAKKNPVSQASAGIGDLCGSSGAEEKCPLLIENHFNDLKPPLQFQKKRIIYFLK